MLESADPVGDKEIRCKSVATAITVISTAESRNAYRAVIGKRLLGQSESRIRIRQGILFRQRSVKGAFALSF